MSKAQQSKAAAEEEASRSVPTFDPGPPPINTLSGLGRQKIPPVSNKDGQAPRGRLRPRGHADQSRDSRTRWRSLEPRAPAKPSLTLTNKTRTCIMRESKPAPLWSHGPGA